MEKEWYSIIEFARKFDISDMTVRRRIKTGKLRAEMRDGKYFIPAAELARKQEQHHQAQYPLKSQPYFESLDHDSISRASVRSNKPAQASNTYETYSQYNTGTEPPQIPSPQANYKPNDDDLLRRVKDILLSETQKIDSKLHHLDRNVSTSIELLKRNDTSSQQAKQEKNHFYQEEVEKLKILLDSKEEKIKRLNQQLEDTKMLVRILEKKLKNPTS